MNFLTLEQIAINAAQATTVMVILVQPVVIEGQHLQGELQQLMTVSNESKVIQVNYFFHMIINIR